jgi:hypothetical protein
VHAVASTLSKATKTGFIAANHGGERAWNARGAVG